MHVKKQALNIRYDHYFKLNHKQGGFYLDAQLRNSMLLPRLFFQ